MSLTALAQPLQEYVRDLEEDFNIPVGLLDSVVVHESGYRVRALNPKRIGNRVASFGLGQLTLNTARRFCGIKNVKLLYNPWVNLKCTAQLLAHLFEKYQEKNVNWVIAAYNAGAPCVCDGHRFRRGKKVCRTSRGKCTKGQFLNQKYVNNVREVWNENYSDSQGD